jgi:exonuclease SbcC
MIRIQRVHLRNFRIHKDLELEFSKGTNVILGENGVGKSTIFISIIFALFGARVLSEDEKGGRLSNLIHRGASTAEVELELVSDMDNRRYVVRRRILGDSVAAELRIYQGSKFEKLVSGNEEVTSYLVEKVFGIQDTKKLSEIIYIRQGQLGDLVRSLSRVMTSKEFDAILGIDKYAEIADVLASFAQRVRDRIQSLSDEIESMKKLISELLGNKTLDELKQQLEERREIEKQLEKLKLLEARLQEHSKLIEGISRSRLETELETIEIKASKIREKLQELSSKETNVANELSTLRAYAEPNKDLLKRSVEDLESMLQQQFEIAKVDSPEEALKIEKELRPKIEQLNRILSQLSELIPKVDLLKKIDELEKQLEEFKKRKHEIEFQIRETKELLKLLKARKLERCPVCGADIRGRYEQIIESKNKDLQRLNAELEELARKLSEVESQLELARRLRDRWISLRFSIASLVNLPNVQDFEPEELTNQVRSILQDLKARRSALENLLSIHATLVELRRRELQAKLQELREEKERLFQELQNLEAKRTEIQEKLRLLDAYEQLLQELESILGSRDLEKLREKVQELESKLATYPSLSEDQLKRIETAVNNLKSKESRLQELKASYEELKQLQKIFESLKVLLRAKVAATLNLYFKHWFKQIYVYPDIEDVSLKLVQASRRRSGSELVYEIYVKLSGDSKERRLVEAGLSGGQRVIVDLALRFALISLFTRNIGFILLDEPTVSLDENIRLKFAEILRSQENLQIIVCTHDELFRDSISGKGYALRRSESGEIVVEELSI